MFSFSKTSSSAGSATPGLLPGGGVADVGFGAVDDEAGPSEVGCEPQRAVDAPLEHALNHGGVGVAAGTPFSISYGFNLCRRGLNGSPWGAPGELIFQTFKPRIAHAHRQVL